MILTHLNAPLCLTLALSLLAPLHARDLGPLNPVVNAILKNVDVDRATETMVRVHSTDRWFTFPKFEETALYLKRRLEESGLKDVEIGGAKADGKTQAGYWTMPLAWDAQQARL